LEEVAARLSFANFPYTRREPWARSIVRVPLPCNEAFTGPEERDMLSTILIIILILILVGAFPSWPYSRGWGYGPSGVVGLILVILLILLLLGKI
jgi:Protein of unknown function (DUF3309)